MKGQKMKKGLTEIICIIDRSGSMSSLKDDAIGGFNSFIEEQKKVEGEAQLTHIQFDHEYKVVNENTLLDQVPKLNRDTYIPRGSTALLDAIGKTIENVWGKIKKSK